MRVPRTLLFASLALGVGISLVLATAPVRAQDGTFYLGAGVGWLKAQASASRFARPPVGCAKPRSLDCSKSADDDAVSFSGFGGYAHNEYLALELGYADLPDSYNTRLINPNFSSPAYVDVQQDSEAFFLRGVFTLPLRQLYVSPLLRKVSVSAVLGVSHWRSDTDLVIDLSGALAGLATTASHSASGNSVTLGARVNYDFTDALRVSAAWDRYQNLGNASAALQPPIATNVGTLVNPAPLSSPSDDVDVFSLNLVYRFN